jgi:hypothetical protein
MRLVLVMGGGVACHPGAHLLGVGEWFGMWCPGTSLAETPKEEP